MRRRHFVAILGGASAVTAAGAWGQAVTRPRRIGFLRASPPPARLLEAFRRGLADRGYVEGQDYLIVSSWGDGRLDRLPSLAAALVKAPVEVIVADGTRPAAAAHAASKTIPIVLAGGLDPVRDGLAKSLSRPGGNVTGFTTQVVD